MVMDAMKVKEHQKNMMKPINRENRKSIIFSWTPIFVLVGNFSWNIFDTVESWIAEAIMIIPF